MAQQSVLAELFGFLRDSSPQVRRIALANLLSFTTSDKPERRLFLQTGVVEDLAKLCSDIDLIAHDALSALINLTALPEVTSRLLHVDGFLEELVRKTINPKAVLSDLAAMLLSNLTKNETLAAQLLALRLPSAVIPEGIELPPTSSSSDLVPALDVLLDVFLKGEGKHYNKNANYDFLASVFANVSTTASGRNFLLNTSSPLIEPPLRKIISFTEHPSIIRRGGVVSAIRNSSFDKTAHYRLLTSSREAAPEEGAIDLLPQLLLPLAGTDEFDLDEMDAMPEELQLLPPDKSREVDPAVRTMIVEILILLATTRGGREAMRSRGVYPIVRQAHLAEKQEKTAESMVRLVNLLMRDEGPETAIEEIPDMPDAPAELSKTVVAPATTPAAPQPVTVEAATSTRAAQPQEMEEDEEMMIEVL